MRFSRTRQGWVREGWVPQGSPYPAAGPAPADFPSQRTGFPALWVFPGCEARRTGFVGAGCTLQLRCVRCPAAGLHLGDLPPRCPRHAGRLSSDHGSAGLPHPLRAGQVSQCSTGRKAPREGGFILNNFPSGLIDPFPSQPPPRACKGLCRGFVRAEEQHTMNSCSGFSLSGFVKSLLLGCPQEASPCAFPS